MESEYHPMLRDRTSPNHGRIIITGTGRSGTTFLVQLFTALGFDTGFSLDAALNAVDEFANAGLERPLVDRANPYVIKSPWFALTLDDALAAGAIQIYAALIPIRSLFEAAQSRRRVYEEAEKRGLDGILQPGSLWYTFDPSSQEALLAQKFHKTIFSLVKYEIPTFLLEFPRIVHDPEYLFRKLEPIMVDHGVTRSDLSAAHARTSRPELIHHFKQGNSGALDTR